MAQIILSFNFILMYREDSVDKSSLKQALKSTGTSIFHKAVGRDTRPAWSNRIIKDFNDLNYEVKEDILKSPKKFRNSDLVKKKRVQEDINNRIQGSQQSSGGSPSRSQIQRKNMKSNKIREALMAFSQRNPQTIDLGQLPEYQEKYLGLCPFEYQNTIQGKMERKSNLHLSLQKSRVSRLNNVNVVQYNRHKDIDFSHKKMMQERQRLRKYHNFNSYTERKVFQAREQLDKFYNTDKARRASSPNRLHNQIRKFETVLERRDSRMNESVALSYQTVPCISKIKQKSVSYSIRNTPREIVFMPQVISEQRGCYR